MEIHNHGKNLEVHFQTKTSKPTSMAGGPEAGTGADRLEQVKPQGLLERLQGDTQVREQLLVEVKAKIAAGEYFTRSAAEEAARQIVDE
jgi:hypothetical protein